MARIHNTLQSQLDMKQSFHSYNPIQFMSEFHHSNAGSMLPGSASTTVSSKET